MGLNLTRTILLVETDPAFRKLLTTNLEVFTGSKIVSLGSADEVTDYLKSDKENPDLIVSVNNVGDEYTILKIFYFVNSQKLKVPIILMGENAKIKGQVEEVDPRNWQAIVRKAAKLMGVTAESMGQMEVPTYYPITIHALFELEQVPIDIYEKEGESYKVLFGGGQKIDQTIVRDKFLQKIGVVYVDALNRLEFAKATTAKLIEQVSREPAGSSKHVSLTGQIFDQTVSMLGQKGMDEHTLAGAKASVENLSKIAESNPRLSDLFAILTQDQSSVLWKHSLITSVMTSAIMQHIDWSSKEQKDKLIFASFFHDIALKDDKLAHIHTKGEMVEAKLSEKEKVIVERHALKACEIIQSFPDVPFGVDNIILQHHGMPNGIGFPEDHLDNRIAPLSIVFRVAEDYAHRLIESENTDQFVHMKIMKQIYNKGQYQKVFDAFEKAWKKL